MKALFQKMKSLATVLLLLSYSTQLTAQLISVAEARTKSEGATVTVTGTVTNGSELGIIRYLQDATAGIPAYGGSVSGVNRNDSITVTGKIKVFNGLVEIDPISNIVNHGTATSIPVAQNVPITAVGSSIEGQLIAVDNVTFTTSGAFAGNTNYNVSAGGNTLQIRVNTNSNLVGTTIPSGGVSLTGVLSQFSGTYQLLLRDVNDIGTYTAPEKKINILINGTNYLSGNTVALGNTSSATITVQNLGTGLLNISNVGFSGTHASAYSSTIPIGSIAPNGSNPYVITITPTTSGTQYATLTISSDDPDIPSYVLHIEAGGTDGLASEPTDNPTNLTFPNVKAYKINASYTHATGSPKYIVLWKNGSAVTETPVDGTSYQRGDIIGASKVAYVGNGNDFSPRGVIANQHYYFAIFAFNGSAGTENYLTTNPLTGDVTSGGQEPGNYYANISTESPGFLSDLTTLINDHTAITYANYTNTIIPDFYLRDTTNNDSYIECQYSGERKVFSGSFAWMALDFSREHIYAHSWMPGGPYNGSPNKPVYSDQHNLVPVRQTVVNEKRSNYPFGIVVNPTFSHLDAKLGTNGANPNRMVYEPRDAIKGDVARALMYMAVSYNKLSDFKWSFPDFISNSIPYGQDIELILKWHFEDLPDAHEIARNEYIFSKQGNRNPFIDSVQYACYIDFGNMTRINPSTDCLNGVPPVVEPNPCPNPPCDEPQPPVGVSNVDLASQIAIFPIPASNNLFVASPENKILAYEMVDVRGTVIAQQTDINAVTLSIDISHIHSGLFFIKLTTEKGIVSKKVRID